MKEIDNSHIFSIAPIITQSVKEARGELKKMSGALLLAFGEAFGDEALGTLGPKQFSE